jgi:cephalosporin-C deacetylase-like acetyl esterase
MEFRDFPRQLEEYYVQRLRRTYAERRKVVAAIRTPAQAQRYRDTVRRAIWKCFAPFPDRTPLNSRVLRQSDFGEYTTDHVVYESRPGFLVSAVFYLPKARKGQVPAMLFTCGHAAVGKAYPLYAKACIRLARQGIAVLAYDPINQGERDLYTTLATPDRPTRANPCDGHNIVGKQLHPCGEWFGTWRAWDGIRSLDYLLTRPEVDPTCIGVAGQSGGGTLSAYLWALEPRFAAVASSCWTTSYLLDLENSMPADDEQYPPGFLAQGLDKIDFFLARAGEPALLLGQELDFFDDRGLRAGYAELKRLHRLLGGEPTLCRLSLDTQTHALSDAAQLEMLRFLNSACGKPPPTADRPVTVPDEPALQATPQCDVHAIGSVPMHTLIVARAARLAAERRRAKVPSLPALVRRTLGVRRPLGVPHHRRLFQTSRERPGSNQKVFRFLVEPEPGILCVLRRVCVEGDPDRLSPGRVARLYLPNVCSQSELETPGLPPGLGDDFWMLDVRGLGEALFAPADPLQHYGHEYMVTGHAVLYGESLLADRVFDVLNAVRLLRAEGAREVHLTGRAQGALVAMLAALLDTRIARVASRGCPDSIEALVRAPLCNWPAVNFPRGVLEHFDLPDVRKALGARLVEDTRCGPESFKL